MNAVARIGDTVRWRGGFGRNAPRAAKITRIEVVAPGMKYGNEVESLEWDRKGLYVVDLDNNNWAYGDQLSPMPVDAGDFDTIARGGGPSERVHVLGLELIPLGIGASRREEYWARVRFDDGGQLMIHPSNLRRAP